MMCIAALDTAQSLLGVLCRRTWVKNGELVIELTPKLGAELLHYRDCHGGPFDTEELPKPKAKRRRKPAARKSSRRK